ncbi:auxin-responsive protein SAUR32-like [Cicer arietinum]
MLGKSFKQVPQTYHGRHVGHTKGCIAIKVGHGEDQQRFTVPLNYLNHPLFVKLLKEAEEEYGFAQQGTIIIPCQVEDFKDIQHIIHADNKLLQHQHPLVGCFRA